jgi:hypothetical protein
MLKNIVLAVFLFSVTFPFAQTGTKPLTVGHPVTISIPDYMNRTVGINSSALIQYKSEVKDVYGFVIEDLKEELKLAEMNYAGINDFYEEFIKDFLEGEEKITQGKPLASQKGGINFIEADISYYDKEAEADIYYLIGIVETKTSFYKVLSYSTLENKANFKADFQKILYSLKD